MSGQLIAASIAGVLFLGALLGFFAMVLGGWLRGLALLLALFALVLLMAVAGGAVG